MRALIRAEKYNHLLHLFAELRFVSAAIVDPLNDFLDLFIARELQANRSSIAIDTFLRIAIFD